MNEASCDLCSRPYIKRRPNQRFCSKNCKALNRYSDAVLPMIDVIANEQPQAPRLREVSVALGHGAEDYRWIIRTIRLIYGKAVVIIRNRHYLLAASYAEAETWERNLGAQRMRELRNVLDYAAHSIELFQPGTERSEMWQVVADDAVALIKRFDIAMALSDL